MYVIKVEECNIIPVDFNVFYNAAKKYKKNIRFSREYTISESFFNDMCLNIADGKEQLFVIDMKNVVSYSTRMFTRLEEYLDRIIICNVENDNIKQKLTEDLESLEWIDASMACHNKKDANEIKLMIEKYCINARKKEECKIIAKLVNSEEGKIQYLESSGLYSNCYVDIKKLFLDVDSYYYIIFCLASQVSTKIAKENIDAFVSSSKNGAIIANILGGLLDIKEVHLIGLGPKYSMELGDSIECIKKGKKYAYIFDFMCTGSELKMASALINSKKAYLEYAAGIARYKRDINLCPIKKIDVLVDTEEMGIKYRIAGKKNDLI